MGKQPLTLRPPHIVTRDDPYWLDVPAQVPWQRNAWTPPPAIEPAEFSTSQAWYN